MKVEAKVRRGMRVMTMGTSRGMTPTRIPIEEVEEIQSEAEAEVRRGLRVMTMGTSRAMTPTRIPIEEAEAVDPGMKRLAETLTLRIKNSFKM